MSETEYSLGRTCAATFAGIKPASLVSVRRQGRRTIGRLARLFSSRGLRFDILREGERLLVFVYDERRLGELLARPEVGAFLGEYGYPCSGCGEVVAALKERVQSGTFPHEVGVLLGYPLGDVRGYLADPHGGQACGGWKAYGDRTASERLSTRYKRCTANICRRMDGGTSLARIFGVG